MSLFWKREREVRQLLGEYFDVCDRTLAAFGRAMEEYVRAGRSGVFDQHEQQVQELEGRADDLRVQIEKLLYSRALLPESRGDLLRVLEAFDHLPNLAETVVFMVATQGIDVPAPFLADLERYVGTNLEAYRHLRLTVDAFLTDPPRVEETIELVDADESRSDDQERALVTAVFASNLDKAEKLHLRELIGRIGDISDHAEQVARRLEIVALKRRV
jgi:predicted phosphate transport protein (TIGR00153 family)